MTYLKIEYQFICVFVFFFSIVILCAVDLPWVDGNLFNGFPYTTFAYYLGAATSMLTGFVGLRVSTRTNLLTTYLLNTDKEQAFQIAFAGSQVYGYILPSFAVGILNILALSYRPGVIYYIGGNGSQADITTQVLTTFQFVAGYALGATTVAIFARIGGGIFAKASDLGSELAGKVGE